MGPPASRSPGSAAPRAHRRSPAATARARILRARRPPRGVRFDGVGELERAWGSHKRFCRFVVGKFQVLSVPGAEAEDDGRCHVEMAHLLVWGWPGAC